MRIPVSLVGAALAASVGGCLAQATPPSPDPSTDDRLPAVRVTGRAVPEGGARLATGTDRPALETPFSATSVTGRTVREQGGSTLQDALRNVPGVQADSGFNGTHTQFFVLRGAAVDSGTGSNRVFRDGVRLSNYPYVPAFVERVDVLRGPGAAFGVRSEPGGTVNLATHRPRLGDAASVHARLGSHGAREFSVDVNRTLDAERGLVARAIATRSEASEWRHVPDALNGVKLGLAALGDPGLAARIGFEATNQRYRPDYGLPSLDGRPVDVPPDRQLGEPFADSTLTNRIVDLHAALAPDAATRVELDLVHAEAESTAVRNLLVGNPLPNRPRGTWARATAWEPDTDRRIASARLSASRRFAPGGLRHEVLAAIDGYRETLDQPSIAVPAATSAPIDVFAPVYGGVSAPANPDALPRGLTTQDLRAVGAVVQDTVDVGDWSVLLGARWDRQRFLYGPVGTLPVTEARWSPKAALLWRATPDASLYANVASGVAPNQVSSAGNRSLPSRRSKQVELGWKQAWDDGRLVSEVAVYRLAQTNLISSDLSTTTNAFDFTVAGRARSRGIEASLVGALDARTEVSFAYAYTDARYGENAVYADRRVPNVARHALNAWTQVRWSEAWASGAGVSVQSRRFADEANTTVLPGYARVDLVQAWRAPRLGPGSLEVVLALRNAFDRAYAVSSHLHVSRWVTPGEGRNVSLAATYRR
jgi:iron complex outermembrane receptor protein